MGKEKEQFTEEKDRQHEKISTRSIIKKYKLKSNYTFIFSYQIDRYSKIVNAIDNEGMRKSALSFSADENVNCYNFSG